MPIHLSGISQSQFPDLINATTVKFLGKGIHHTKAGAKIAVVTCIHVFTGELVVYSDV